MATRPQGSEEPGLGTHERTRPRALPRGGRIFRGESVPHMDTGLGKGAQWRGPELTPPSRRPPPHDPDPQSGNLGLMASKRATLAEDGARAAGRRSRALCSRRGLLIRDPSLPPWGTASRLVHKRGSPVHAFHSQRPLVPSTVNYTLSGLREKSENANQQ